MDWATHLLKLPLPRQALCEDSIMAKGWAAFVNPHELLPRDKVNANDTPFATRIVENKDANGVIDGTFQVQMRVLNNSGSALVAGQVYFLTTPATPAAGTTPQAITGAALAAVPRHYCV